MQRGKVCRLIPIESSHSEEHFNFGITVATGNCNSSITSFGVCHESKNHTAGNLPVWLSAVGS